jgi:PAS domain S-box-containing protein
MKQETRTIKVLHLEDLPEDAELVQQVLRKSGDYFEVKVVDTQTEFETALKQFIPHVVISDHSLPSFNSLEAMQILENSKLNIPFILVTGTVSDEFAAHAMKKGATDYILKDRLQRLPTAIAGALDKVRMEREQQEITSKIIESEKQYFDLIQHLPAAVYTCDTDGRILTYNRAALELWGRDPFASGDTWCGSTVMMDKDGNLMNRSASPMARAIAERRSLLGEEIIIERPDGTRRYVLSHPIPNFSSAGEVVGCTNMLVDITDRKNSEVEMLRLVDNLQSRNKELAQFAYMISHHLRAPIARVLGLASIFNTNPEEDRFIMKKITEATEELDEVVKDINLVVSARNPSKEKYEFVNFNVKVNLIKKVLEKEIRESDAEITEDFTQCEGIITIHSHLYSILTNLLSNAIKFRSVERPLRIVLKSEIIENFVCLLINDNGRGIDIKKHHKHLFSMYRRFHKDPIPGKGVGLHLVKAQTEALGGKVAVESKVDEGTVFKIYLPLSNEHREN